MQAEPVPNTNLVKVTEQVRVRYNDLDEVTLKWEKKGYSFVTKERDPHDDIYYYVKFSKIYNPKESSCIVS